MIIQNVRNILIPINELDSTGIVQRQHLTGRVMGFSLLCVRGRFISFILNPYSYYRLQKSVHCLQEEKRDNTIPSDSE